MSYLTSHRKVAEAKYGNRGPTAFKTPEPYKPTVQRPIPANENYPRPANDNRKQAQRIAELARKQGLRAGGARILSRFPWMLAAQEAARLSVMFGPNSEGAVQYVNPFTTGQIPAGGWSYIWTCQFVHPGGPPTHMAWFTNAPPTGFCPGATGSGAAADFHPLGAAIPPNIGGFVAMRQSGWTPTGDALWAWIDIFSRPTPGQRVSPFPNNRPWLNWPGTTNPNLLPIGQVMGLPLPVPLALAPYRANDPIGSQRTYGPRKGSITPRRPPGKGEKEVKLRANSLLALRVLQKLSHGATELIDYIDAVHDALPKKHQAKARFIEGGLGWRKASPQAKAQAVWQNFGELDWNDVAINLIKNEVGDRILGRANAKADAALNAAPGGRITRGIAF